jgi:hypothetical protein
MYVYKFIFECVYPTVSRARASLEQALAFNRARINPDFGHKFTVVIMNGNCAGQLGVVGQAVVVLRVAARHRYDSASDAGVLRRERVTREIIIICARRVAAIASRSIIGKCNSNVGSNVV